MDRAMQMVKGVAIGMAAGLAVLGVMESWLIRRQPA